MPPAEISRICSTVAVVQLLCNVTANWLVFSKKGYRSALERFDQATKAKDRADRTGSDSHAKGQKPDKRAKRVKKVEEDYRTAAAIVSGMHLFPNLMTSVVFFILLRIFGTEMKGSVIGILPFKPFSLLRSLTGRGLDFSNAASFESMSQNVTDIEQACSFMFVSQRKRQRWMLAAASFACLFSPDCSLLLRSLCI
jgi:hypothetical protein